MYNKFRYFIYSVPLGVYLMLSEWLQFYYYRQVYYEIEPLKWHNFEFDFSKYKLLF